MKILIKNLLITVLVSFILVIPVLSLADTSQPITPTASSTDMSVKINSPINVKTIDGFIKILLEGVIKIGIPIVALAIIYSGFLFVSARGNSEALDKAKRAFMYSVIGAAILLGAWAIAQLISDTVLEIGNSA